MPEVTAYTLETDDSTQKPLKGELQVIHVPESEFAPAYTIYLVDRQEADPDSIKEAITAAADQPKAAGLAVIAEDTGRLLLLQRALSDEDPRTRRSSQMEGGLLMSTPVKDSPADVRAREKYEEFLRLFNQGTAEFHLAGQHDQSSHGNRGPKTLQDNERDLLGHTPENIRATIQTMLSARRAVEPKYTKLLQDVATANKGELLGLEFRFKGASGIVGKVDRKVREKNISPETAAKSISDSLRYTVAFQPSNYTSGLKSVVRALKDSGVDFVDLENSWDCCPPKDAYQGINAVFIDKSTRLKIELQVHTPGSGGSFIVKDKKIHADYVFIRERKGTREERKAAFDRMVKEWEHIETPPGVLSLGNSIEGIPVKNVFRPWKED